MRFMCNKFWLEKAINAAVKGAAKKSSYIWYEKIKIAARNGRATVTGFNSELCVTADIPGAEIIEDGSCLIDHDGIVKALKKLPDDSLTLEFEPVEGTGSLNMKLGKFSLTVTAWVDENVYPEMPVVDSQPRIKVSAQELKKAIEGTRFAVSSNQGRPIMCGCWFGEDDGKLAVVGCDGYRLAVCWVSAVMNTFEPFVIKGEHLKELVGILGKKDSNVVIAADDKYCSFTVDEVTIVSRLLGGGYLDWKKVIDKRGYLEATVEKSDFRDSLERVSVVKDKKSPSMKLQFLGKELTFETSEYFGKVSDRCDIKTYDNLNVDVWCNPNYLADAIKYVPESQLRVMVKDRLSPVYFVGDEYLYEVLPINKRKRGSDSDN